jgi:hypothetical protein
MDNFYQIQGPSDGNAGFLIILLALQFITTLLIAFFIPSLSKIKWWIVSISFAISILVGLYYLLPAKETSVRLSEKSLIIADRFYPQSIPRNTLIPERAKVVNLNENSPYNLSSRLDGVGLPKYHSGWYTLRNGEKALVVITRSSDVVYIPTNNNYSILVSVTEPNRLLKELYKQ